jgi:hypothetical protein
VDLERLAGLAGLRYSLDDLEAGMSGSGLLELRTNRGQNVALHRELSELVGVSLSGKRAPGALTTREADANGGPS